MPKAWQIRFERIRNLGWVAAAGGGFLICALMTRETLRTFCVVSGVLLVLPAFIYGYVMVILHWKDRYRGNHSDLWGTLILIETSGWMKLVYLFRHMIPDMRQSSRYRPIE